ncbi:MAG TPA: hypothetical protein VIL20_25650 [Sandaracinaceae bacterium]
MTRSRLWSFVWLSVLCALGGCGLVLDLSSDAQGGSDARTPECAHDGDCQNGDACDGAERCEAGECVRGTAPSCDDGVACTVDSCDRDAGCVHEADDALCPAGHFCHPAAGCMQAVECFDDDDCAHLGFGECAVGVCNNERSECEIAYLARLCDDGIACTVDACAEDGTCSHAPSDAVCDDGATCSSERCDPASPRANADGCVVDKDDEFCAARDDGAWCTVELCAPEERLADRTTGCISLPIDSLCESPFDACYRNVCVPGFGCLPHVPAGACPDGEICELGMGICLPLSDDCRFCDDGNPCNGVEACVDGVCRTVDRGCPAPDDACYRDTCDYDLARNAWVCRSAPSPACYAAEPSAP